MNPKFLIELAGIANGIVSAPLSGMLSGVARGATYDGNRLRPNVLPDFRDMLEASLKGTMDKDSFEFYKPLQGVKDYDDVWQSVIESKHPSPSLGQLMAMYYRGGFSGEIVDNYERFIAWAKRAGWWQQNFIDIAMSLPFGFSPESIRVMHSIGSLSDAEYRKWLASAGMARNADYEKFAALHMVPTPQETIEIYNREIISFAGMDEWHKLAGLTDPRVRSAIQQLRFKLPSPSNLISFAVKEAWNRDVVNRFGYDDEFDQIPEFEYWMERAGFGGNPNVPGKPSSGLKSWAQAFWREHWTNISPSQAYSMFHRFRPTGGPNGGPRVPQAGTFTLDDVNAILKINDYPPYFRNKLAMLSYLPMRLVDIKRVVAKSERSEKFKDEVIGKGVSIHDWAYENFLDRGQSPNDAQTLASLAISDGREAAKRAYDRKTNFLRRRKFKVAQSEYAIGIAGRDKAIVEFKEGGLNASDAVALADTIDREFALNCARGNMAITKKLFFKGTLKADEAEQQLVRSGFTEDAAKKWVLCWRSTKNRPDIQDETMRIIELLRNNIIDEVEAIRRLTNLGWTDAQELVEGGTIEGMLAE